MRLSHQLAIAFALSAAALPAQGPQRAELPDAPGRDTMQRICSACHPAQVVLGKGMSREQWGGMVSNMISRGAKGTDAEFAQIVDYLATNLPPHTVGGETPARAKRGGGGLLDQAGPSDKQIVDDDAANRGKTVYVAECITCHGAKARGGENGPDLVRSLVVLKDRYGSTIGPYLLKPHPANATFTKAQIEDLSHFLHQKVGDTLRTGPYNSVLNVLTGDPKAGEVYFNGAGKCSSCHSATGDLAGVAKKYDPPSLQLKTVFPQTVAFGRRRPAPGNLAKRPQVQVSVTVPSGETVSGTLVSMDDFNVALRDSSGQYHSFDRTPEVKITKTDPYAAHVALLDQYTDKDIHNVVAYLETLK